MRHESKYQIQPDTVNLLMFVSIDFARDLDDDDERELKIEQKIFLDVAWKFEISKRKWDKIVI